MWGRKRNSPPTPAAKIATPRTWTRSLRMCAAPYEATPMQPTITASLPMEDGQNSRDGKEEHEHRVALVVTLGNGPLEGAEHQHLAPEAERSEDERGGVAGEPGDRVDHPDDDGDASRLGTASSLALGCRW